MVTYQNRIRYIVELYYALCWFYIILYLSDLMRYLAIFCATGAAKIMTQNAIGHVGVQAFIQVDSVKPDTPRFNNVTAPETNNVMMPVSRNWKTRISYFAGIMMHPTLISCCHMLVQRIAVNQSATYYNRAVCAYGSIQRALALAAQSIQGSQKH